jgi:DNA topoisomerase-2
VNGINTSEGGTHVDYIVNQIVYKLKEQVEKKHKDLTIRPSYIKDNIMIFINCLIENPTFSSQTKEHHVTKSAKFGSTAKIGEDILKKIEKLGITSNVIEIAKAKENKSLSKTDGKKQFRVTGITKLDDANKAGGAEGYKCKLILTEGDSAKASAVAGLSVIGRDYYGVFPLRGKLLNVRDATAAQILKNEEINSLKKILGLQQGKEYTSVSTIMYDDVQPLSEDKGQMKEWINDELTWRDVYSKKPVEYLEAIAQGKTPKWDSEKGGYVYGDSEESTTTIGGGSKSKSYVDPQMDSEVDTELPF